MSKAEFLLLLVSVVINSASSLLVKQGTVAIAEDQPVDSLQGLVLHLLPALNLYTVSGLVLIGVSFGMYILLVSRAPVSIVQPMLALSYMAIAAGAYFIFREPLSLTMILGMGVIVFGVYLLSDPNGNHVRT